jgi:hypothetical protein
MLNTVGRRELLPVASLSLPRMDLLSGVKTFARKVATQSLRPMCTRPRGVKILAPILRSCVLRHIDERVLPHATALSYWGCALS